MNKGKKKGLQKKQKPEGAVGPHIYMGVYSNAVAITHTQNEFSVDFLHQLGQEAQLVSRVILSPTHMVAFGKLLADKIKGPKKRGSKRAKSKEEISVIASWDIAKGVYSNIAGIHETEEEYVIDFLHQIGREVHIVSRIIMTASHMLRCRDVVAKNLSKYRKAYPNKLK